MTWLIGIDEAGYGPNLGPLVMSAVACRVPDAIAHINLWKVLKRTVRRGTDADDGRLLIDDSKVVYSTARGLEDLETGVHAVPGVYEQGDLDVWLAARCASGHGDLCLEPWYRGDTALPAVADPDLLAEGMARLDHGCASAGITDWLVRVVVICPPRFNSLVDGNGSKGAVLAEALTSLLRQMEASAVGADDLRFAVDKHGGRNCYAALIQHGLQRGMVAVLEEGMERSAYRVHGLGRETQVVFQPRAESEHLCVALASMVSKYVRELCMTEFNRFWRVRVPGLKPTAGYPTDATRFWKAIRPAAVKMGLTEAQLWRQK
jgi:ribonuclease HII